MTTNVGIGLGSQFWLANASAVLTQLDELLSVTPPNPQVDDVEATHMGSTAREFIAGLTDYGSGEFKFNFIPGNATDVLIRAAVVDKVARAFKIVLPIAGGSTHQEITGNCIVKGWVPDDPIDDRMTATLTVRFTGSPSYATV
jgi:hypothetical protein